MIYIHTHTHTHAKAQLSYRYTYLLKHLFQSECRILMLKQSPENLVLQAVMDENEADREKGNITSIMLNKEKVMSLMH